LAVSIGRLASLDAVLLYGHGLRTEADLLSYSRARIAAAATVLAILGKIGVVTLPEFFLAGIAAFRSLSAYCSSQRTGGSSGRHRSDRCRNCEHEGLSALILVAVSVRFWRMPVTRLIIGTNSTRDATIGVRTLGFREALRNSCMRGYLRTANGRGTVMIG